MLAVIQHKATVTTAHMLQHAKPAMDPLQSGVLGHAVQHSSSLSSGLLLWRNAVGVTGVLVDQRPLMRGPPATSLVASTAMHDTMTSMQ